MRKAKSQWCRKLILLSYRLVPKGMATYQIGGLIKAVVKYMEVQVVATQLSNNFVFHFIFCVYFFPATSCAHSFYSVHLVPLKTGTFTKDCYGFVIVVPGHRNCNLVWVVIPSGDGNIAISRLNLDSLDYRICEAV